MFANSLLIRFSSNSRARAFLKSAINFTRPDRKESVQNQATSSKAQSSPLMGGASPDDPLLKKDVLVLLEAIVDAALQR